MDIIIPGLFPIVLGSIVYLLLGFVPMLIITGAAIGGFILYLKTGFRAHFDTSQVIFPYLLTIMLFIVHVYEEYLFGFEHVINQLNGKNVITQMQYLTLAGFIGPFMWVGGAYLILKQWDIGYYFLAFFFVAMTIAELTHFIFPFIIYGHWRYTAGVVTAALPLIPAWYGLGITIRETRKIRGSKTQKITISTPSVA